MERNRLSSKGHDCPLVCITKAVLFFVISVFILYLPLGDPNGFQCGKDDTGHGPICILCDLYFFLYRVTVRTITLVEYIGRCLWNSLYNGKLTFYSFLETVDKKDLCQSVCCAEAWDEPIDKPDGLATKRPRQVCRCVKKKCTKQKLLV